MHHPHYRAYSANKNINRLLACIVEDIGGYGVTWKMQENVLHHTYVNITHLNDDIDGIIF
jgi:linoleoyl-CoA desaturase